MVTDWNCHPIRHRLCFQKPRPLKRREARRRRKEITTNLTSTSYVQINNITSGMQLVICTMIQWKILIAFFLNKGRGLPSTQPLVRSSSSALQVTARPSGFSLKSRSHIHNPSFKSRWKCKKKKKSILSQAKLLADKGFSAQLLMCHPSVKNWTGSGRNWASGCIGELSCSLITMTGF